ncbi:hypothetical protein [Bacillus wiedmannii]|uniref:hypothetical protein n=1 Tax=Bacillus wiedmannii TaxID=1890302 RepID=UPI00211D62B2|nr:hypothetical protein [Bacillus wiedmannii]MDM5264840.1 hypothetical protein [Bacillus wiedmannii]
MSAFDSYSSSYAPISKKEETKKNIKDLIGDLEQSALLDNEIKGKAYYVDNCLMIRKLATVEFAGKSTL